MSVQSPLWLSSIGSEATTPLLSMLPFRIIGTRKSFVPIHRPFSQNGFSCEFPDPLRLITGQTRFTKADETPPVSNQPDDLSDPFLVSGGVSFYPNINSSLKSFPFITCQTALANLQANAFLAIETFLRLRLRSYHDCIRGLYLGA